MSILKWSLFSFVEYIFIIGILSNLLSYLIRFYLIHRSHHTKTFLRTLKEGFSKKIILRNIFNLSLLITSMSVFWYMIGISKNLSPLTIEEAYPRNPYITSYILVASVLLLIYSIVLSIINIYKIKELTPALGYLSFWNSADNLFNLLGGGVLFKPITDISANIRKHLIQAKLSEALIGAILLVIFEYIYKIFLVLTLVYLIKGKIL